MDAAVDEAAATSDPERRAELLAAGLLTYGAPFALSALDADEDIGAAVAGLIARWCSGATLTERADEPELRVRVARDLRDAAPDVPVFGRFLAGALIALPAGHGERDLALASELVIDGLAAAEAEADQEEELEYLALALDGDLLEDGHAVLARGDALAAEDPAIDADAFLEAARRYAMRRLTDAEEARDDEAAQRWSAEVAQRSAAQGGDDLDAAVALQAQGRWAEAAERWGALVAAHDLADSWTQSFAFERGRCLLRAGSADEAAAVLTAVLPHAERSYLATVRPEEVADGGELVAGIALWLATARARAGAWSEALWALDRRQGLRLRFMAALRQSHDGAEALALHRVAEEAIRCGAPPAEVAALLEGYRAALARAAVPIPGSPTLAELARGLEPAEAVLVLALHPSAMLLAVVCSGDRDEPSSHRLDATWTRDAWLHLMADEEEAPGWASVLAEVAGGAGEVDPFLALEWLRNGADEAVGAPVRALLDRKGIRRLTIVADSLLALVPWSAVPSFEDVDLVSSPSLGHIAFDRAPGGPVPRSALFVVNPTGDAHASPVAATAAASALAAGGLTVARLSGPAAQEAAVVSALDGCGVLHFAGHGRWNVGRGGLELHAGDTDADGFDAWVSAATEWRSLDAEDEEDPLFAERRAEVPGVGPLQERRWLAGSRTDRWLERPGGTLVATYEGDALQRVGELWSALDVLLGDAFRTCRLCVLTACESAVRSGSGDPAAPELPGALMFAGARTVVGTLWPIEDRLAALWTSLFYAGLGAALAAGAARVDVAALVRTVAADLAGMPPEEAAARLLALADATPDPVMRLVLEAEAHTLGPDAFAAPWSWAAFYVTGDPILVFGATR